MNGNNYLGLGAEKGNNYLDLGAVDENDYLSLRAVDGSEYLGFGAFGVSARVPLGPGVRSPLLRQQITFQFTFSYNHFCKF